MKKILLFFLLISNSFFAQQLEVTFDVSPETFEEDEMITITASEFSPAAWGVTDVYLWAWSSVNGVEESAPNNGDWSSSDELQKMTKNVDGSYSISFIPKDFYERTDIYNTGK